MTFIREATVTVNIRKGDFSGYEIPPIEISGLRVSFSILKSLAWSTNSAVIKIWNLSQSIRNIIKDYGDQVILYAGYERGSGTQLLYLGDTTAVSHIYEFPEIVTILECGDGEKYLNQLRVSVSFAANTPARSVISAIAQQMGIEFVEFASTENLVYRQGFKGIGMGKDVLTNACNKLGLQWSVQNNQLQIIPLDGSIQQTPIEINENTGMQGVPTRFTYRSLYLYRPIEVNPLQAPLAPSIPPSRPVGYKVNTILNPLILPGSAVNLTSNHLGIKGPFRVENVRHEGDTYGFVWSSNLELTQLNSTP
jgi:hypothetical protein